MLNLSDKELDRLSKEAAQEYEPGEVLGPESWEKLNARLDSDLGRVRPNPLNHIRRFRFYYAPALLVLLGISYFYLTRPPTSQPLAGASTNHSIHKITTTYPANSTPALSSATSSSEPDVNRSGAAAGGETGAAARGSDGAAGGSEEAAGASQAARVSGAAAERSGAVTSAAGVSASRSGTDAKTAGVDASRSRVGSRTPGVDARSSVGAGANRSGAGARKSGEDAITAAGAGGTRLGAGGDARTPGAGGTGMAAPQPRELVRSEIMGRAATSTPPDISDSALRAFTLKSMPPPPIHRSLHINRNWQFGFTAAPDFASVNSLAGDKPGSTLGITVDYQFKPRWYLSSGLLLDRRNYAARAEDFHPPISYYQNNGIMPQRVDFVKGTFQMLEIPLNLRYDFSVTGNTLFFATAGVSSFLLATDKGNCYEYLFNHDVPWAFQHPGTGNYFFSAMNLSLGVETGLSNSMSILIAPYMKTPLGAMGFGQVKMSSVGITFGLKWAPVTSRRRR